MKLVVTGLEIWFLVKDIEMVWAMTKINFGDLLVNIRTFLIIKGINFGKFWFLPLAGGLGVFLGLTDGVLGFLLVIEDHHSIMHLRHLWVEPINLLKCYVLGCLSNMEVSKLSNVRGELLDSSCLFVLNADIDVLIKFIHDLEELFELFGSLLVVQFQLLCCLAGNCSGSFHWIWRVN